MIKIFMMLIVAYVYAQSPCCGLFTSTRLSLGSGPPVPLIMIDTFNHTVADLYRIPARICTCNATTEFDSEVWIEIRGSSSARESSKKSFSFTPRVTSSRKRNRHKRLGKEESPAADSFMGFPQGSSTYSLYGPENDLTLGLRNWMSMWISREAMGRYASRTVYVDVYLVQDGIPLSSSHYWGVMVAMEKIERGRERVNISALKPGPYNASGAAADISGGYIDRYEHGKMPNNESISFGATLDQSPASSLISTNLAARIRPLPYLLAYPDFNKRWTTDAQTAVLGYISDYMAKIELAFLTLSSRSDSSVAVMSSPMTVLSGRWRDLLDEDAFIDYFLITEISKNPDGYRGSVYAHKDKGGKLMMGPAWDYNEAYPIDGFQRGGKSDGSSGGSAISPNGWRFNICEERGRCVEDRTDGISLWYQRAFRLDPMFKMRLSERWSKLREGSLSDQAVVGEMGKQAMLLSISGAARRNYERWISVLGPTDPFVESVETLKTWLVSRLQWIDKQLLSNANQTPT